jgi:hypothetical protein
VHHRAAETPSCCRRQFIIDLLPARKAHNLGVSAARIDANSPAVGRVLHLGGREHVGT